MIEVRKIISVSVIVTAYNQSETIEQTLDCILNQVCDFNFEIIIGDDCSTDCTKEICEKYRIEFPEVIKPLYHKVNVGVATNFVSCVQKSKGEFIAICASDDYWHNSSKLQLQVDCFLNNPDCGFIYTDYNKLNVRTGDITESFLRTTKTKIFEGENLIKTVFSGAFPALTLTVMFRKELFEKYIPVEDYIKHRFTLEDWPTWLIMTKYTRVVYLSESTATYRFGHDSLSNPSDYFKVVSRFEREKKMYKYICDLFPDDLNFDEKVYDIYIMRVLLSIAIKKNDYISAKKYASSLIRMGDRSFKARLSTFYFGFYCFITLKRLYTRLNG